MDAIFGFLFGVGGLVVLGLIVAFLVGWYILATRARRIKEIT
jgi:hypothetical protein